MLEPNVSPLASDEELHPSLHMISGSLAKLAAMRRALAVHIYDHQHLEARPWTLNQGFAIMHDRCVCTPPSGRKDCSQV